MNVRRDFLKKAGLATSALGFGIPQFSFTMKKQDPLFKISLAEWSVNRLLFSGQMDHLDFPLMTKKHGILAVEYVNQFFMDKANDKDYLREMNTRCKNEGITQVLIMVDREGTLGAKGVSLKPTVFDDKGNQSPLDYEKMMKIVLSHGYHGHVGIEHGEKDREWESIVEIRDILGEVRELMKR